MGSLSLLQGIFPTKELGSSELQVDMANKGLVSKIYKQFMMLNSIKYKQTTQKMDKRPQ